MFCQNCQMRIAKVHFTQIVNKKKVEMFLCEECASEKGQFNPGSLFNINDFLTGLIGYTDTTPFVPSMQQDVVCKKCGMSFEEFKKMGKLGCSSCYSVFGEKLEPILKRLHGTTAHTGRVPGRVSKVIKASQEIKELKDLLNKAIQKEEYEKAAEIRDKIKARENEKDA